MKRTMLALGLGLALITTAARADEDTIPFPAKAFQNNRFYVGMDGGLLFNGGDDVRQLENGYGSTSSGFGGLYDLKLGWQSRWGLAVEAGYQGLGRVVNVTPSSFGGSTVYFNANESTLFVEPLWRIPVARWFTLGAGLGLGLTQDRLIISSSNSTVSYDLSGSGGAYWPELRGQFLIARHVGLELSAGYRVQETGSMSNGASTAKLADGSDWHVKNDGVQVGLGLNIYFGRL